jgi:TorA maturation chaperone TorD
MQEATRVLQEESDSGCEARSEDHLPLYQELKQGLLERARKGDRAQLSAALNVDHQLLLAVSNLFMLYSLVFRYPSPEVRSELERQLPYLRAILQEYGESAAELPSQTDLEAEHVALFVNNNGFVPAVPYASFYLDEGQLLGPSTRRLRRMMSELGLKLREERHELEDHIYALLELCAEIAGRLSQETSRNVEPQWLAALLVVTEDYLRPMLDKLSEGIMRYASFDLYPAAVHSLSRFALELDDVYASALGLGQESPAETDCVS